MIGFGKHVLTNEMVEQSTAAFMVDKIYPGAPLMIAFAFVSWDSLPKFDFFGRSKKLENRLKQPINRILIRDVQNSWYQRPIAGLGDNVYEVAKSLHKLITHIRPSRVICVGQSMGAYGAIILGALLGVDEILAFGTLSFLNTAQALIYHDRRWYPVMEDLEQDPPTIFVRDLPTLCRQVKKMPPLHLYFGTLPDITGVESVNTDAVHAHRFLQLEDLHLHPVPESQHAVVLYLIEHQRLDDILYRHVTGKFPPDMPI